jgi:hypothetical protein
MIVNDELRNEKEEVSDSFKCPSQAHVWRDRKIPKTAVRIAFIGCAARHDISRTRNSSTNTSVLN